MNINDVKIFLATKTPSDAPEEHVFITGFEPWQIEKAARMYMTFGKMKALENEELWEGAAAVRDGAEGPMRDLWAAYYASVKDIDMFPTVEQWLDVTPKAIMAIAKLKELLKGDDMRTPINAHDHQASLEKGVGFYVCREWISRAELPVGLRAALVLNSKEGQVDIHSFGSSPKTFNAGALITSLFKQEGKSSAGHYYRARYYARPSVKELHQAISSLVTGSHTNEEMGWRH